MDPAFAERNVNEGFSGGEKKRHEILQLELLKPKIAILDETDSGLDVDALQVVSEGVNRVQGASGDVGVLLITHYTRILRYIQPDFVHVFVDGRIVEEGGPELADELEAEGYERFAAGGGGVTDGVTRGRPAPASDDWTSRSAADFPILTRTVRGGHPLVYLDSRRHLAEAARRCSTPSASSTSSTTPPCTAARTSWPRRPPRRTSGARDRIAAFVGARGRRGGVHQERHRGASTWSPTRSPTRAHGRRRRPARFAARPRRRDRRHRDGAPRQPRAVAGAVPAHRRDAALVRVTDDGRLDLADLDDADHRAHQGRRVHPRVQHARHGQPGRASSPTRAHEVGALVVLDACQSVPHLPVDVDDARRRLRRLLRPQDARARPASACSGAAASCSTRMPPFLTGGSMIETVTMERLDLRRRRRSGSRPACPMTSQAVGLGAAVDYLDRARDGRASHAHEHGAHRRTRSRGWPAVPGVRVIGPPTTARPRGRGVVRRRRRPPARRRPGARRPRRRGAGRPPLRVAAAPPLRRRRRPPARRFYLYTTPAEIDALVEARRRHAADVLRGGVMQLERCTRRSSWTTTSTRTTRACASPFEAEVHHVNPTCGDEVTLRVHARRRRSVADVSYDGQGCSITQASRQRADRAGRSGETVGDALDDDRRRSSR